MKFKASKLTVDYIDAIEDIRDNIQTLNAIRAQVEPLMPAGQQQQQGPQQQQQQQQQQPGPQQGPQQQQQPGQQQPGPQPQGPGQQQQGPGPQPGQPGAQNQQGPGQQQPGVQQPGAQQGPVDHATLMREIQRILRENMSDIRLAIDALKSRDERVAVKIRDALKDLKSLDVPTLQNLLETLNYLLDNIDDVKSETKGKGKGKGEEEQKPSELSQGMKLLESKVGEFRDYTSRTVLPKPLYLDLKIRTPQGQIVYQGTVVGFLNFTKKVPEFAGSPEVADKYAKDLSGWIDSIHRALIHRSNLFTNLDFRVRALEDLKGLPNNTTAEDRELSKHIESGKAMVNHIATAPLELDQNEPREKLTVDADLLAESLMDAVNRAKEELEARPGSESAEVEKIEDSEGVEEDKKVNITSIPLLKGYVDGKNAPEKSLINSIDSAIAKGKAFGDSNEVSAGVESLEKIKELLTDIQSNLEVVDKYADLETGEVKTQPFKFTIDYAITGNKNSIEPFYLKDIDFSQKAAQELVKSLVSMAKSSQAVVNEMVASETVLTADHTKTTEEGVEGEETQETSESLNLAKEASLDDSFKSKFAEFTRKLQRLNRNETTVYTTLAFKMVLEVVRTFAKLREGLSNNEMILVDYDFAENMRSGGRPNAMINVALFKQLFRQNLLPVKKEEKDDKGTHPVTPNFYEQGQDKSEAQKIKVYRVPLARFQRASKAVENQ